MLAALPADDYGRISPLLTVAPLKSHQVLQKRDEPLREIYFPSQSLTSLVLTTTEGASAEIAVVGSEGLVGIEAVLGLGAAMCDATVQVAGDGVAHSMNVDAFRAGGRTRWSLARSRQKIRSGVRGIFHAVGRLQRTTRRGGAMLPMVATRRRSTGRW